MNLLEFLISPFFEAYAHQCRVAPRTPFYAISMTLIAIGLAGLLTPARHLLMVLAIGGFALLVIVLIAVAVRYETQDPPCPRPKERRSRRLRYTRDDPTPR